MKIAITTPTTWPFVRRGGERFINDLARYLAAQGHDVTVISGKPGPKQVIRNEGYVTVCHRRLWYGWMARLGLLEFHMFFFPCLFHLLRERYDVVFSLTFMDAFAALVARRFTGVPCVFYINGLPPKRQYFRSLSLRGAVFGRAVRASDAVMVPSDYSREYFETRWGRACQRLWPPFDCDLFQPRQGAARGETVLCAAALNDQRKGGRALMQAFNLLKARRPGARLCIAYPLSEEIRAMLLDLVDPAYRRDVEFVPGTGRLPELFRSAAVSVLPSLWEAFGLVVVESMAAGTPVVGTRDGALPEIISSPAVGRLFDPGDHAEAEVTNVTGLAEALDECIELSHRPETARRCREHALTFSWRRLGPQYEELLRSVAGSRAAEEVAGL